MILVNRKKQLLRKTFMPAAVTKKNPRPVYFLPATVLILLVSTLFRVWDLAGVSLWSDEHFSRYRHELSFSGMINDLAVNGTQVPLYFIIARLFPADNHYLLRMPALFTALVSIALFILVIERLYGRPRLALLAGALLAFNPYHIWLSRQARFYPLLFLLALASSFLFLIIVHRRRSTLRWILFMVVTAGAYLTHYFALALPVAQYLYMFAVVRNDRGFLFKWFAAQTLAFAPAAAWFVYSRSQPDTVYGIAWIPEPGPDTLPTTLANFLTGFTGTWEWYFVPALLLAAGGLVAGIITAVRRWKTQPINLYWVFLVFVPPLLIYLYSVAYLDVSIYMDRYFMGVLPGAIMLMLVGWNALGPGRQRLVVGLVLVFLMLNSATVANTFSENEHEMYDFISAAEQFEEKRQPGDGLMLVPNGSILVFERYAPVRQMNDLLIVDPFVEWQDTAPEVDWVLALQEQVTGVDIQRMWVIFRNPSINQHRTLVQADWNPFAPSRFAEEERGVHKWLSEHRDDVIYEDSFNGIRLFLLEYEVPVAATIPYPAP
jgi:hypothetical protein